MTKDAFCRFIPTRWRAATLRLSLEAEGLLIRISAFNMEVGVPLPRDRTTACRMISVHRNKFDKLLSELLEFGDLVEDETGIYSPRALTEFQRANAIQTKRQPRSNPKATPEQPKGNPGATPQVDQEKGEQFLRERRVEEKREDKKDKQQQSNLCPERAKISAAVAGPKIDYDHLENQLRGACNGALANPAVAQGLADLSLPISWMRNGADLEADILPTLRAIGKRDHGKGISNWKYFDRAVSEAKARRERGLPPVEIKPAQSQTQTVHKVDPRVPRHARPAEENA